MGQWCQAFQHTSKESFRRWRGRERGRKNEDCIGKKWCLGTSGQGLKTTSSFHFHFLVSSPHVKACSSPSQIDVFQPSQFTLCQFSTHIHFLKLYLVSKWRRVMLLLNLIKLSCGQSKTKTFSQKEDTRTFLFLRDDSYPSWFILPY